MKMYNGNSTIRQNITAVHWNMGSKFWPRKKDEIEAVILEYRPDIFLITEANMSMSLTETERNIPGYNLLLPRTIEDKKVARIVMLVREDIEVKVLTQYMDTQVASIWIKVITNGTRSVIFGGIYWEHCYIGLEQEDDSASDRRQAEMWNKFIET